MRKRWIAIDEDIPPFVDFNESNGNKSTDIVDIKYDDETRGEGFFIKNDTDTYWMIREGEEVAFLYRKKNVTHWKPKGWIID